MILQVTALFNPCFFFQAKKRLENSPWDSPTKKTWLRKGLEVFRLVLLNTCLGSVLGVACLAPQQMSHCLAFWEVKFFGLSSGGSGVVCLKYFPADFFRGFQNQNISWKHVMFYNGKHASSFKPICFLQTFNNLVPTSPWFPGLDFWTMQFLQILKINWGSTSKNQDPQQQLDVPSLKLNTASTPENWWERKTFSFPFGARHFFRCERFISGRVYCMFNISGQVQEENAKSLKF